MSSSDAEARKADRQQYQVRQERNRDFEGADTEAIYDSWFLLIIYLSLFLFPIDFLLGRYKRKQGIGDRAVDGLKEQR